MAQEASLHREHLQPAGLDKQAPWRLQGSRDQLSAAVSVATLTRRAITSATATTFGASSSRHRDVADRASRHSSTQPRGVDAGTRLGLGFCSLCLTRLQ